MEAEEIMVVVNQVIQVVLVAVEVMVKQLVLQLNQLNLETQVHMDLVILVVEVVLAGVTLLMLVVEVEAALVPQVLIGLRVHQARLQIVMVLQVV